MRLAAVAFCAVSCAGPRAREAPAPDPKALAALWDRERVSPPLPPLMDHAEVVRRLQALRAAAPELFHLEEIGRSVEGRSLNYVRAGTGDLGVLLWSQMHGDEPTATAALFDLFEYLRRHRDEEVPRRILSSLTLHVVPMLNPDGAERFQRRNAQGIDINRDALMLQTPEGRALKALRDRLNPAIGFNLHNQNWRTSVGRPPQPAAISLLSVAFDEAKSDSPGRRLTRQVCAVIRDALEPFAAGRIGRYSDEFEVRAFGDNITRWGTPVVLIETGPWPGPNPDEALVRLNFVALVSALDALATGRVREADPARYEALPLNESRLFFLLVRQATVVNGAGIPPFTADVGVSAARRVRARAGRRELETSLTIEDLGDLRVNGSLETIDAAGLTLAPLFGPQLAPGAIVALPDWTRRPARRQIAVGQPADLVLLKPAEAGRYTVVRVIRSGRA
ncbi:MAG TPA: M14 family metallopeptidase, partial [Vicinamibacterales bacterium]|nr:M14 family metallopeptidase [Vicinamibacterales bacterium]